MMGFFELNSVYFQNIDWFVIFKNNMHLVTLVPCPCLSLSTEYDSCTQNFLSPYYRFHKAELSLHAPNLVKFCHTLQIDPCFPYFFLHLFKYHLGLNPSFSSLIT